MNPTLFVCTNRRFGAQGSCGARDALALLAALEEAGLPWEVRPSPCLGWCADGPNVKAAPGGPMLHDCRSVADILARLAEAGWPPAPKTA